jgi:2-methylisocitrate lyase-like PEP mutase family enzyme
MAAKLIERAGFPAVYMTGSGVANTLLGVPDVGLLTQSEMTFMASCISRAVDIPVIADADTGYGNAVNVMRTIREFEASGAAGMHLEDQIAPKRCGHIVGKELISAEEMVGKIKAAVDARTDPDFILIARTDARGPVGLDEAIRRANLYAEAGADMVFPDALLSEDEFAKFAAGVRCPKMMNMGGYSKTRTTPKMALETVQKIGFNLVIFPLAVVRAGVRAEMDFLQGFKERGTAFEIDYIEGLKGHPTESWYEFTGIADIKALETKYLPKDAVTAKYTGRGHMPGGSVIVDQAGAGRRT